jgi:hypothetical protein
VDRRKHDAVYSYRISDEPSSHFYDEPSRDYAIHCGRSFDQNVKMRIFVRQGFSVIHFSYFYI